MYIDQSSITTTNTLNSTLGSTALHGACSNDHLEIVEYLIRETKANYFIENQAEKIPIEHGGQHPDIKRFFQDYLLISYLTSLSTNLPNKPIKDEDRLQQDCS